MANIYKSLTDLIERNKSLFDFLKRKPSEGLYKAIWEARNNEINELKKEIKDQSTKYQNLEQEEETSMQIIEGLKEKNFFLRDQVALLAQKNQELEGAQKNQAADLSKMKIELSDSLSRNKEMNAELKKIKDEEIKLIKLIREKEKNFLDIVREYDLKIENAVKDRERITKSLSKEIKEINSLYKIELLKVHELKEQMNKLKVELSNERAMSNHLKTELLKLKENTRRYRALNHRMEEELSRIDLDTAS